LRVGRDSSTLIVGLDIKASAGHILTSRESRADAFARLRVSAAAVREVKPDATAISAGMSGDLEAAVEAGATHLRIGTALLGDRGPRVR